MKSIFSVLLSSICFISSCANENIDGKWIVSKRGKVILNTRPINYSKVTSPDSLIIDAILDEQNESMLLINTKLETNFVSEFTVYLFNSDEAKEKIGTNGGGHVNLTTLTIYYTFLQAKNPKNGKCVFIGAHELVHLIANVELGHAKSRIMSEGFAVAVTGNYGSYINSNSEVVKKDIELWMKEYILEDKILKPTELINGKEISENIFYPQAGFFINWLFDNYGVEKVNKLYKLRKKRILKDFEKITGESFYTIEKKYLLYCYSIK